MRHCFLCVIALSISFVAWAQSGTTPKIMEISTEDDEFGGTLSPDGKLFFFCKRAPSTGRSSYIAICFAENKGGAWTDIRVAPFSGTYRDFNPQFSHDGKRLYFMSTRPIGDGKPKPDSDIWFVEKTAGGWSEPVHMSDAVNSPFVEYACSFTNSGDMYLSSGRNGRDISIYVVRLVNGEYREPERVSDEVNSGPQALDACIAPDESYLLFTCTGREDMLVPKHGAIYSRSDMYISFNKNGSWTKPVILPEPLNSIADDGSPAISRDGMTLYFTSKRNFVSTPMKKALTYDELEHHLHGALNGFGNIYSISTENIKRLNQ
jgi:hypothetical protein